MTKSNNNTKRKNFNPCDFFMAALSINYPKTKDDEEKIKNYTEKYGQEQSEKVLDAMENIKTGELDVKNIDS